MVIVIHENRGLNEHIRDVARRVALAGFRAVAPDFLSPAGGTPADEDQARDDDRQARPRRHVATAGRFIDWLSSPAAAARKGRRGRLLLGRRHGQPARGRGRPKLRAGVPFYGPAPDPAEAAAGAGGDADPPRRKGRAGERDRASLGRGAEGGRQERDERSSIPASSTPSTTTRRPSATTSRGARLAWADDRFLPAASSTAASKPALTLLKRNQKKKARRRRRASFSEEAALSRGCP
jgi:hypothetical protein